MTFQAARIDIHSRASPAVNFRLALVLRVWFGERIGDFGFRLEFSGTDFANTTHSLRNACIGSIRDALHAGTRQASTATTSRVAATAAKIAGSSGRVP